AAPPAIHTLSLHDALPIYAPDLESLRQWVRAGQPRAEWADLVVMSGVVRQVAAAAQHRSNRARQLPWAAQPRDDAVEERTAAGRSEEHTSELQSPYDLVCR